MKSTLFQKLKTFFIKYYKWILFIVVIVLSALYIYYKRNDFVQLLKVTPVNFAILSVVSLAASLFLALEFNFSMKLFHVDLPFKEWYGLTAINSLVNLFSAKGGLVARAVYLKKKVNFVYSHYASLIAGNYLIMFNYSAIIGLILSVILHLLKIQTDIRVIYLFAILTLTVMVATVAFLLLVYKIKWKFKKEKINEIIERIKEGLNYYRENKKFLFIMIFSRLIYTLLITLRLFWAMHSIGAEVNFFGVYLVITLTSLSQLLVLTPGNLGIREGIIGITAFILTIPSEKAVVAATLDRVVVLIWTAVTGGLFSAILLKNMDLKQSAEEMTKEENSSDGNLPE